jgi:hypothetical protein
MRSILGWIDLILVGIAAAMFIIGALLLRLSPTWWGYYLTALDVRIWPTWKCIGFIALLIESLLIIWYWPNKKRSQSVKDEP